MPPAFFFDTHTPIAGEIVWCRYPYREAPGSPGRKVRPALILNLILSREKDYLVRVAYGTSRRWMATDAPERPRLEITDPDEYRPAGLKRPTIFLLDRTAPLPWREDWFPPRRRIGRHDITPIIGALSPARLAECARKTDVGLVGIPPADRSRED